MNLTTSSHDLASFGILALIPLGKLVRRSFLVFVCRGPLRHLIFVLAKRTTISPALLISIRRGAIYRDTQPMTELSNLVAKRAKLVAQLYFQPRCRLFRKLCIP
jgi:hypothetical protein